MERGLARLKLLWAVFGATLSALGSDSDSTCPAGGCAAGVASPEEGLSWQPKTLSVVLPCAGEGEFVIKTAQAVSDSVPGGGGGAVLSEIVVVDDGSKPPVAETFPQALRDKLGVKLVRNEKAQGLIRAKSIGAAATTADVIVFFDCHVGPQPGWHEAFLETMAPNYRRIAVPSITDLDIDTWTQTKTNPGVNKCYLTWDADFKWFRSKDDYIPILSGGLLGISRRWWLETGGYDDQMDNWGGENIDQSLRTWLCGGEIVAVPTAQVAHMWRKQDDKRTLANYRVNVMKTLLNRARAARGWFGNFSQKLAQYPDMHWTKWKSMDISAFDVVRERLGCRPFAWYLWRFRDIYEHAGLVPQETFRLEHVKSGKCLTYLGPAGTHPQGSDKVSVAKCGAPVQNKWQTGPVDPQRWHRANQEPKTGKCCSGFRAWNTDQCLSAAGGIGTHICEVSGRFDMQLRLTDDTDGDLVPGQLIHPRGFCLKTKKGALSADKCKVAEEGKEPKPIWRMIDQEVPLETELYARAKEESPELFAL